MTFAGILTLVGDFDICGLYRVLQHARIFFTPKNFDEPYNTVLPLFKIRYPEINSENSWNFTNYPEILQKVPVFYINMMLLIPDFCLILEMLFFYPGKSNKKILKIPEFREKWKHCPNKRL